MKTIQKIFLILLVALCIFSIVPNTVVLAENAGEIAGGVSAEGVKISENIWNLIGKILGYLQLIVGIIAIISIAFTGFNYITSSPDMKAEVKKKWVPIVIGVVLVFSAVSVSRIIINFVANI